MFNFIMRLWAAYAGEQSSITSESGLAINDSLINKPLGASEMAQLVNLHASGLLSKITVLDELQRGGILDPDLNIDDELERITEDKAEQKEETVEQMEMMQEMQPDPAETQQETEETPKKEESNREDEDTP